MSVGIQTSIWNNNIRSIILLALYPFLIAAIIWACAYVIGISQANYQISYSGYGFTPQELIGNEIPVHFANNVIIEYWPGITTAVVMWFMISYFWNTAMIRALSGAHAVTRKEEPDLYNLLENLCIAQGMPMPQINIIESHARNAFASGVDQRSYTITVTRGLLNSLSKDEVEGVLAHELTHIINRDVRLMMVTVIFTGMVGFFAQVCWSIMRSSFRYGRYRGGSSKNSGGILVIFLVVSLILWIGYMATLFTRFAISRRREFMADAGAVQMTKNPDAMMRALMRIAGRDNIPNTPADVDMMCIENAQPFFGIFATHPPIDNRIQTISEMTNTAIPQLPHTGPTTPDQSFGDRKRRNPWISAQRR
jgi:heat shock protein HtpX